MTSTLYLIGAMVLTLLCIFSGLELGQRWHKRKQAPEYRTMDCATMDREVRALCAKVPDASTRQSKPCCNHNCNQGRECPHHPARPAMHQPAHWKELNQLRQARQAHVHAQGAVAARQDMARGTVTPCPHHDSTPDNFAWCASYAQAYKPQHRSPANELHEA